MTPFISTLYHTLQYYVKGRLIMTTYNSRMGVGSSETIENYYFFGQEEKEEKELTTLSKFKYEKGCIWLANTNEAHLSIELDAGSYHGYSRLEGGAGGLGGAGNEGDK